MTSRGLPVQPCTSSRDTWRHLLSHVHGFWISSRLETPQLHWGQPVQMLGHSLCRKVFLETVFQCVCPLPLVMSSSTTENSLSPSSLHPPLRYLYTLIRPSLLQAEQSQLSPPFLTREMLHSLHHLCSLSLDSLQYVHLFLVLGSPEMDSALRLWPYQCWSLWYGLW